MFDSDRISQVLVNLISNALKFTKEGYLKLSSSYSYEDEKFEFSLEDTGVGIKEDDITKLFKIFSRLDGTKNISGIGLGLNTCRSIIENLGGKIWVESEYGKGSKFTFTFDCKESKITENL